MASKTTKSEIESGLRADPQNKDSVSQFNNNIMEKPQGWIESFPNNQSGPSQTFFDHLQTSQRSTNLVNIGAMSPDERQTYNNEAADNWLLESIKMEVNYLHGDPPIPIPRPSPGRVKYNLEMMQDTADKGRADTYARDFAAWNMDYYTPFGHEAVGVTLMDRLTRSARSDGWYFKTNTAHFMKNSDQYIGIGQFLVDSFKRARSVGYPVHVLAPTLHGPAMTYFTGQNGDYKTVKPDKTGGLGKAIDHSKDQSMNTGASLTGVFIPGKGTGKSDVVYDPFYSAIGDGVNAPKDIRGVEIKANDNKSIYVVRT